MSAIANNILKGFGIFVVGISVLGLVVYRSHVSSNAGIGSTNTTCISADEAASHDDQTVCVEYLAHAYTSQRGSMYLDKSLSYPYGFSAYIPAGTSFGSDLLSTYDGKTVDVTGKIQDYKGEPEIIVSDASQVVAAN